MLTDQDVLDDKLQGVNIPVLIIWGKEEKLIPMSVGEQTTRWQTYRTFGDELAGN